jgi:integrase
MKTKAEGSKRANGEGALTVMKDGRWRLYAWVPVSSGGTKRKAFYGLTKTKATKNYRAELAKGPVVDGKKQTLRQYLEEWLPKPRKFGEKLKPNAIEARKVNIERVCTVHVGSDLLGNILLNKVTDQHIGAIDASLIAKNRSPATRLQCFVTLKTAFNQAVRDKKLVVSPFAQIPPEERPKVSPTPKRIITKAEKVKLFALNDEWTNLWKLLLATGLREGEALGLMWANVDMEMGLLHVRKTIDEIPYKKEDHLGYRLGDPKSDSSKRTVMLQKEVLDVLTNIKQRQEAEAKRIGKAWSNSQGFVFTRLNGRPILCSHALKAFKRSLKSAGIWDGVRKSAGDAYIHHLRHTFGHDHLNNGTPIHQVSKMMGHSSVSFTIDVYGSVSPKIQEDAAKLSSKLLADASREAVALRLLESANA